MSTRTEVIFIANLVFIGIMLAIWVGMVVSEVLGGIMGSFANYYHRR